MWFTYMMVGNIYKKADTIRNWGNIKLWNKIYIATIGGNVYVMKPIGASLLKFRCMEAIISNQQKA